MTEIWMVRHGQTDWNRSGRFQGQTDIPLNEVGLQQAQVLAGQLAQESFEAIYSSDLSRAYQTAEAVARVVHLPIQRDTRLREICQGEWEGLDLHQVIEKYNVDIRDSQHDPASSRAPGGESVAEVAARMSQAANEIAVRHPDGKVLLVTHGLACASLYCVINHISLNEVHDYIPENATPIVIYLN